MSGIKKTKRITFKHKQPNPLFQSWLQELYDEAKAKDSKLQFTLKEALTSITKYPLPLQSGAECAILKGFGKKMCLFLDKRLEFHRSNNEQSNQDVSPDSVQSEETHSSQSIPESDTVVNPTTSVATSKHKSKAKKSYTPAYRSGAYAILIALQNNIKSDPNKQFMNKTELMEKAQPFCEESFTRPKPNTFYTAWSSMAKLVTKGLVSKKRSKNVEFMLTEEGVLLATELSDINKVTPSVNEVINNKLNDISKEYEMTDRPSASSEHPNNNIKEYEIENVDISDVEDAVEPNAEDFIRMPEGSFDVILLIDKQETCGAAKKNDPIVTQINKYPDLKHEYRSLKVGDFTWIAKSKSNAKEELVLPYIIERKRMDDFGSSIKDGRFHEQKFRLRKCGLKNVIYMVENYGSNKYVGLPVQSLMQALNNTRVQDNFKVHMTDSFNCSIRFLAMMTKRLTLEFKDKSLTGRSAEPRESDLMTFEYFNRASMKSKTLTVNEAFIKLLLQLKGMSVEKVLAITNVYQTPKSLIEAYKNCNRTEGETLLAHLKDDRFNKNVGLTTSKSVYQLFTIKDLL